MTPRTQLDFERAARAVLPHDVFEFIATGARDERTLEANVAAWRALWFLPRVLMDVSDVCIATDVLGQPIALPVLAAPMSVLGMVHADGDAGVVRAATASGTMAIVSQSALTPLADIAREAGGRFWAQHYPLADPAVEQDAVQAALAAGASAIVVTVDFPLHGVTRGRPVDGFTFPPDESFPPRAARGHALRTSLTTDYVGWLQDVVSSRAPIVVKGVLHPDDAVRLADQGVAAVIVSNHGGRTLDGAVPTAEALPAVVAAVQQRMEVYVDGGIRRGADILRALSLGARAVLVGRPLAWGLASGGQRGVEQVIALLRRELVEDAALAGVADVRAIPCDLLVRR